MTRQSSFFETRKAELLGSKPVIDASVLAPPTGAQSKDETKLERQQRFHAATVSVIQEYLAQPGRIGFPDISSKDGFADTVNSKFWSLRDAARYWVWKVNPDVRPADAIQDAVLGHPGMYRTECRQARQLFDLMGLLRSEVNQHGVEAGKRLFDARFTRNQPKDYADTADWVARFHASGQSFADFARAQPPPPFETILELSQAGPGNDLAALSQFALPKLVATGMPGDAGYMPNWAVKPSRMRAGWAGENFFVAGQTNEGELTLWGHGVGLKTQSELRTFINKDSIAAMPDFLEYFDTLPSGKQESPSSEKQESLSAETASQVERWLRKGPLESREAFARWLGTAGFKQWYQENLGQAFSGPTTLADVPLATLQHIVEAAIPATKRMPTAYSALNGQAEGQVNTVSEQMAALLKNCELEHGSPIFERRQPFDMRRSHVADGRYLYGQSSDEGQ